ncbi:hypothetical protein GCM10010533_07790 [Mycolicibacterium pallens]
MRFGEGLGLEASARTEDEDPGIGRRAFGNEDRDHPMDIAVGGHHLSRAVGVPGYVLWIVERVQSCRHIPIVSALDQVRQGDLPIRQVRRVAGLHRPALSVGALSLPG